MKKPVSNVRYNLDSLLADLIMQHPSLIPVVSLTGIGGSFDGKTIRQVAKEKAINESYLFNLLLAYTDEGFVVSEVLPSYSVLQLTALSSAIYPYFLNQLDTLFSKMSKTFKYEKNRQDGKRLHTGLLKKSFAAYRRILSDHSEQQQQIVLPHTSTVYELYYSPDYTSGRADILKYSLEFYDGNIPLLMQSFHEIKYLLEQTLESTLADMDCVSDVYAFYRLNKDILAQVRVEQNLLKPMVLQMEESIITTFHKKNKWVRRNNYLSLHPPAPSSDVLSPREKEVLQLVAQGFMNKQIADQLQIGLTTVISHRKNIVEKLGIRTVPGLTVYAYAQGYLDDSILTNED